MRSVLPTEDVIFRRKVRVGKDKIGNPIFEDQETTVSGCLITPLSAAEMVGPLALLQRLSYIIHLPSDFDAQLPADVVLRGQVFKVVFENGRVSGSPLPWDRSIVVEAVAV